MARSVATIKAQILASFTANPNLVYTDSNGIVQPLTNNTSAYSIFGAIAFCVATCIAIFEQLLDLFVVQVEAIVAASSAASTLWIQAKMFQFQYSASNPQIVQLIDTVPQYPVVDTTLCIITACSVTVDLSRTVNIKVAKGNPYQALATAEINAAQTYIDTIGDAGIDYEVISLAPDRLYIGATVYFNGQYSSVIQTNVIAALNAYLQTLSVINFNGSIKMSDLENVIRGVVGVNDVIMNNVSARPNATAFGGGVQLIVNNTLIARIYNSAAGYMIQEDTAGQTFADSITFIAQ